MNNDIIRIIKSSRSFEELKLESVLPEPFNDSGYYFIYYDEKDYKEALVDIINYINKGIKVWYNRFYEKGESWENDMINIAKDFKCRAVIFYLSENSVKSPYFYRLLNEVKNNNLSYASINLASSNGDYEPGARLAGIKSNVNEDDQLLINKMFSEEVTYLRYDLSIEEKASYLNKIKSISPIIIRVVGESATVIGVKDIAEHEIIIPKFFEDNGQVYPVESVAPFAFEGCRNLTKVVFPDSIKHIGYSPFDEEGNGESVDLIGGCVFKGCQSLKEIVFPPLMEEFYSNNFIGCVSLKSITITSKLRRYLGFHDLEIDDDGGTVELDYFDCFNNFIIDKENNIYFRDQNYGYRKILYFSPTTKLVNALPFEVKDKITLKGYERGGDFTQKNSIVKTIDLSDNKEEFHAFDFIYLENLEEIKFNDGCVSLEQCLIDCPNLMDLFIPQSIQAIKQSIIGCNKIETIRFPKKLRYISYSSLQHCESLHTLIFEGELQEHLFRPYNRDTEKEMANHHYAPVGLGRMMKNTFIRLASALVSPFFILALLLLILFPLTIYVTCFAGRRAFYDNPTIQYIYIKNETNKKYKIRGFKKAESDKEGYSFYKRYKNYRDKSRIERDIPINR